MNKFRSTTITPAHEATLEDLRQRILDLAVRCVNKGNVEYFGSVVSGFAKVTADADLSLTYRNFSPWLLGISSVADQDHRRMTRLSREASEIGMEHVRYVRARIPVVQMIDPITSIHVDVSIGNIGGVGNSKILRCIREIFPDFVGAYVHIVKEWGKAREVISPEKSAFNSFTLTTMALMVLQELGLVPVFDQPSGKCGELQLADVEEKLRGYKLPAIYDTLKGDEQKGEAVLYCFIKFAEYYEHFDFVNGTVSLMCPRRHRKLYHTIVQQHLQRFRDQKRAAWIDFFREHSESRESFDERQFELAMHDEEVQRTSTSPFVVEDFVNYVNCARRVPPANVGHIKAEFKRLREMLSREDALDMKVLLEPSSKLALTHLPEHMDPRVSLFKTRL